MRFLSAVLLGSLVMLATGFLLYGVLFAGLFQGGAIASAGVMKEQPAVLWIVIGQLAFAVLLGLMISWRDARSVLGGAQTGAILGFLMAMGYDFAQYGTSNLWTAKATLLDPLLSAILIGLGGAAMGWVLRGRSPSD